MNTIFLALGSNVGNKKKNILSAINRLGAKIKNIAQAKFYRTKPMYYKKQDEFLNTLIRGTTDLKPQELLGFVKEIENKIGRKKSFHWGPREIDIDIIFYNNLIYKSKSLEIPHPRIQERDFVLKPLLDIDREFVHPILKKKIKQLYQELSQEQKSIM